MMKKIFHLFLFLGYFAFSQEYKIENEKLKGNISSLNLFALENNDVEIPVKINSYDKKGRILVSKIYYNGRINSTERNEYSKNQIVTEICDYCNDLDKIFANFSIKENQKYPYKGYGTNDPKRTLKIIQTTDKKGNIILSKTYSLEGYLLWFKKSTYDKNSNLLLEENYDDDGKKESSYKKNSYNKKGLISEMIVFENDYERKSVFSYDNLDRILTKKEWLQNQITEKSYEYKIEKDTSKVLLFLKNSPEEEKNLIQVDLSYSENDKQIKKEIHYYKDKPNYIKISEFDKNNNLLQIQNFSDQNELRSEIKLLNDKKGNWIHMNYSELIKASYNGSEPKPEWRTRKYVRKIEYN